MKRFCICLAGALTMALVGSALGQDGDQTPLASNSSFNASAQPGYGEMSYGIYPAPYWAPANVGYSYYSYAPLMPHEHLYAHRRLYWNSGDNTGTCSNTRTRTRVVWHGGCSHVGPAPILQHGRRGPSAGCGVARSGCPTGDCSGGSK